jgi:hypothetical protein
VVSCITGDPFTWQFHIVFDGTVGSTLYDTVTVTDWGSNSAYLISDVLTVYSGIDWTVSYWGGVFINSGLRMIINQCYNPTWVHA